MEELLVLIIIVFSSLLARSVLVMVHELGHAIPALVFTQQKVTIYLGSYGEEDKSFHFMVGRLEVWAKYYPPIWNQGLCIAVTSSLNWKLHAMYVMGGPLASLLLMVLSFYGAFTIEVFWIKTFLFMLAVACVLDTISNINGASQPIKNTHGKSYGNDFAILGMIWAIRNFPKSYGEGVRLYNSKNYVEAAQVFELILADGLKTEVTYQLVISSQIFAKNYQRAKTLVDEFEGTDLPKRDMDYINSGVVYSNLRMHHEAIMRYEKALQMNADNYYGYNNKGFSLLMLGKYEEALPLLNKAIRIDKKNAYAYANRGVAFIKTGEAEKGLLDVQHSLSINADNSFAHEAHGIYYFEKKEYEQALNCFARAQQLDADVVWAAQLSKEARAALRGVQ